MFWELIQYYVIFVLVQFLTIQKEYTMCSK